MAGCDSSGPRDTPEATIASLKKTIEDGRADRLGDFIYDGGDPEMRKLLRRVGVMTGNLQKLGTAVQTKFPEQVAKLRADVEAAAAEGRATSLLSQIAPQTGGIQIGRGRRKPPSAKEQEQRQEAFNNAIKSIFADPYGWAEDAEKRLTTTFLTDDSVALLWDGKPIMPPLGMTMKQGEDDRWYFVLPFNAPGLGSFMPKNATEYKVFGSVIRTMDNVVIDVTKDVTEGRVDSIDALGRTAGEKAFIPMVMVFAAYGNLVEDRRREARRQNAPAATAPASAPGAATPATPTVTPPTAGPPSTPK